MSLGGQGAGPPRGGAGSGNGPPNDERPGTIQQEEPEHQSIKIDLLLIEKLQGDSAEDSDVRWGSTRPGIDQGALRALTWRT